MKPKLRFKEFTDEWKQTTLSDFFDISAGGDIEKKHVSEYKTDTFIYPIYANALTNNGLYGYSDIYKIDGKTITVTGRGDVGKAIARNGKYYPIVRLLVLKSNREFNNIFFENAINNIKLFQESTGVPQLTSPQLGKYNVFFPSILEQDKIASLLSLLDKKIELQSKKIEDLKLFKKGLSNKIFSTLDVIKEEKLGNICNITTGKLDANAMVENGQYRFYTCAKDYYYIDKYAFDTEALLISGNGAYVGYIHYYKGKFNAYQRTYVLDQFTENIQYIKVYLDEFLSKRINSEKKEGNTPYIVLSTLSDMTIELTNSKEEKNVINTFNNINLKINKEELKLNKLIELKKGLMQSMFV